MFKHDENININLVYVYELLVLLLSKYGFMFDNNKTNLRC
jgi:hypothetical protein